MLDVLFKHVCRHGDDRNGLCVRPVQAPDGPGRCQAVHHRHPDIHENGVVIPFRMGGEHLHRDFPVFRMLGGHVFQLQQIRKDFRILLHILSHQNPAAGQGGFPGFNCQHFC